MLRHFTFAALLFTATAGGLLAVAAQDPYPGTGKASKADKQDRAAEKWAMKLAKADPATAEKWAAMKAEKDRAREEAQARKEREREEALARKERERVESERQRDEEKAAKLAKKNGLPPTEPEKTEDKPDPRPTVLRYGNLPKELPKWWAEVDADRDVQLSLYEWRTSGRKVDDFTALDPNGDGYVTVEEYLRATAPEEPRKK